MTDLTAAEIERYGRHLVMPEVGLAGQERLAAAKVLVVGAGGLGSPAALYLAAAGIGRLGLIDFDSVAATNLQRQILYRESDIGRAKLEVAGDRLQEVNPHIEIIREPGRFERANARELVSRYDIVLDGSDNFPTRYLVNDACVLEGTPNVFGSVLRFEGQVSVFGTADGPCYRCLFPEPPPAGSVPSCAEAGVLGVLPGIIGSLQALEAIKLILGLGDSLIGRFLVFDGVKLGFRELALPKADDCPLCSSAATQRDLVDPAAACTLDSGSEEETMTDDTPPDLPLDLPFDLPFDLQVTELERWMAEGKQFRLIDVRTPMEWAIAKIESAILMPMNELPSRLEELDRDETIVVQCHHGPRSTQVVRYLRQQGFARACNLAGGIHAWSLEVDSTVPKY